MKTIYTLFPNPDAPGKFGYMASSDAGHAVKEQWLPGAPGHVPMDEAVAKAAAEVLCSEWEQSEVTV